LAKFRLESIAGCSATLLALAMAIDSRISLGKASFDLFGSLPELGSGVEAAFTMNILLVSLNYEYKLSEVLNLQINLDSIFKTKKRF
jgi:uncharacterized membrane protein YgaE (UPF0421/DUF939 family)